MLFSEIYGSYFSVVADILKEAVDGQLTEEKIYQAVRDKGFEESSLNIPQALKSQEWPLVTGDYETPLMTPPAMPLTTLQKRWMKSLLNDPKIKLFGVTAEGLDDVEPLFDRNTIIYYDQYADGDDFEDETYIRNFRTILQAFKEKRKIRISFASFRTGRKHEWICIPHRLEYSLKDDKFRFTTMGEWQVDTINLSTITECELLEKYSEEEAGGFHIPKSQVVVELVDERNALERAMLHFSHLQKETVKLDDNRYRITLTYNRQDETEILIRIISFGPMLKVVEPQKFISKITERLEMQRQL